MKKNKKSNRYVSVRKKMLGSLVLISLLLTVSITLASYLLARDSVSNISMQLCRQDISSKGTTLSENFRLRMKETEKIMQLSQLRQLAVMDSLDDMDANTLYSYDLAIEGMVNSMRLPVDAAGDGFDFVGVYLKNGYTVQSAGNTGLSFSDYNDCYTYFTERGLSLVDGVYNQPTWQTYTTKTGKNGLAYVRFLYGSNSLDRMGVVVFGINESRILERYANMFPNAYVISDSGVLLSSDDPVLEVNSIHPEAGVLLEMFTGPTLEENRYNEVQVEDQLLFYMPIQNLKAYLVVPFDFFEITMEQEMGEYLRVVVTMGICVVALAVLLAIYLSIGISRSTAKLTQFTKDLKAGNHLLRFVPESNDEIAFLGGQINDMLDEMQKVNDQREEDLRRKQVLEVQLLQQQINPHLLYNTLDSVLWALQQRKTEEAEAIVESLSEFFKRSLARGHDQTPLAEELKLVEYYLDIQNKARNRDYRMVCKVAPEITDSMIYKLTLQPLVENSIIHGFAGFRDDGTITITASRDNGVLEICVQDDGIGMTEEEVENINHTLSLPTKPEQFKHFGLYNIHSRIVNTYGSQFGLHLESEIGEYTVVHVRIPDIHPTA